MAVSDNRVQCWLCKAWVLEKYTEEIPFLNTNEKVCIMCIDRLEQQDEQHDMKWRMRQDAQGTGKTTQGQHLIGSSRFPDDSELAEREDELESVDKGKDT